MAEPAPAPGPPPDDDLRRLVDRLLHDPENTERRHAARTGDLRGQREWSSDELAERIKRMKHSD